MDQETAPPAPLPVAEVGVIVIGRNEGQRLRTCLASAIGRAGAIVYVDSGSTDGSVEMARAMGVEVVELDLSIPFTAARARNAGADRLRTIAPDIPFLQFVDGDCELVDGWLDRAARSLAEHPRRAIVCGRLRERFRDRSLYNRLADIEWDGPIGEIKACGGIMMVRAEAFRNVGGFESMLIAGEEPDLCVRLRAAGWSIVRIDAEMAWHDIAMTRFDQWWRRSVRTGHAYAEGAARHGRSPDRHYVRQLASAVFWAGVLPTVVLTLIWPTSGGSLVLLAGYPVLYGRTYRATRRQGRSRSDARLYAAFCLLAKVPHLLGLTRYGARRLIGRPGRLIEYKKAEAASTSAASTAPRRRDDLAM